MRLRHAAVAAAVALSAAAGCADGERRAAEPAPAASPAGSRYDKPGFWTKEEDGRLWVFRAGSPELAEFRKSGPPLRLVTRAGAGPGGMALRSSDAAVIDDYLAAK